MLVKYREELTRPIQEAMEFIRRIESQLSMLCQSPIHILNNPAGTCHQSHIYIHTYIIDTYIYAHVRNGWRKQSVVVR